MTMKNRVTVTVRQDGREIVCSLSAVTVFFVSSGKFWKGEENLHLSSVR